MAKRAQGTTDEGASQKPRKKQKIKHQEQALQAPQEKTDVIDDQVDEDEDEDEYRYLPLSDIIPSTFEKTTDRSKTGFRGQIRLIYPWKPHPPSFAILLIPAAENETTATATSGKVEPRAIEFRGTWAEGLKGDLIPGDDVAFNCEGLDFRSAKKASLKLVFENGVKLWKRRKASVMEEVETDGGEEDDWEELDYLKLFEQLSAQVKSKPANGAQSNITSERKLVQSTPHPSNSTPPPIESETRKAQNGPTRKTKDGSVPPGDNHGREPSLPRQPEKGKESAEKAPPNGDSSSTVQDPEVTRPTPPTPTAAPLQAGLSLQTLAYIPLGDLSTTTKGSINVIGVVFGFREPTTTVKGDYSIRLDLTDPSIAGTGFSDTLGCNIFAKDLQGMPKVRGAGVVVLLRGMKATIYQERVQLLGYKDKVSFSTYDPATSQFKFSRLSDSDKAGIRYQRGLTHAQVSDMQMTLEPREKDYMVRLANWYRQKYGVDGSAAKDGSPEAGEAIGPLVRRGKRPKLKIEDIRFDVFSDLVVEVLKYFDKSNPPSLYVTDWTSNPLLLEWTTSMNTSPGPRGRYILQISLFDDLAQGEAEGLRLGDVVEIRNVRGKKDGSGRLEGVLHEDKDKFGAAAVVKSKGRIVKLGLNHDDAKKLRIRKAGYHKALFEAERKAAEEKCPAECKYKHLPIKSIRTVNAPGSEITRHRLRGRVGAFLPAKVEEWIKLICDTCGEEYDCDLNLAKQCTTCGPSSSISSSASSTSTGVLRPQWVFAFLIEDEKAERESDVLGSLKDPVEDSLPVIVTGTEATYFLGIEPPLKPISNNPLLITKLKSALAPLVGSAIFGDEGGDRPFVDLCVEPVLRRQERGDEEGGVGVGVGVGEDRHVSYRLVGTKLKEPMGGEDGS